MTFSAAEMAACERLARAALDEDLGTAGDLTSQAVIRADAVGQAVFRPRVPGVVAGLPAARLVFTLVDTALTFEEVVHDGARIEPEMRLAVVRGPLRSLLTGERTALNFLQRLSGIATLTSHYARQLAGLPCRLLDTRKTTPGWRLLEKYAVRMGGGHNHRMGLFDGILIKDNHLAGLQIADCRLQIEEAMRRVRTKHRSTVPVEVEVDTLEQLDIALAAGPDVILLDNMTTKQLREAVHRRDATAPRVLLEASGGVNLATVREIAETGVDRISVGALTHSATALDIGLDYLP
jgi:nicotinate-nucleotide pyrophosphorylase (carboxylating)